MKITQLNAANRALVKAENHLLRCGDETPEVAAIRRRIRDARIDLYRERTRERTARNVARVQREVRARQKEHTT